MIRLILIIIFSFLIIFCSSNIKKERNEVILIKKKDFHSSSISFQIYPKGIKLRTFIKEINKSRKYPLYLKKKVAKYNFEIFSQGKGYFVHLKLGNRYLQKVTATSKFELPLVIAALAKDFIPDTGVKKHNLNFY